MIAIVTLRFGSLPYFDVSAAQLERYSSRHGYDLHVADGTGLPDGCDRRWSKVQALLHAFDRGAKMALYLDADCVIVDESQPVSVLASQLDGADLLVGRDSWWHANTGVLLATSASRDILEAWSDVPRHDPETMTRWPVDELGFNRHIWPAFKSRIACPIRVRGSESDLLSGPFVHHFPNGTPAQKRDLMTATLTAGAS